MPQESTIQLDRSHALTQTSLASLWTCNDSFFFFLNNTHFSTFVFSCRSFYLSFHSSVFWIRFFVRYFCRLLSVSLNSQIPSFLHRLLCCFLRFLFSRREREREREAGILWTTCLPFFFPNSPFVFILPYYLPPTFSLTSLHKNHTP